MGERAQSFVALGGLGNRLGAGRALGSARRRRGRRAPATRGRRARLAGPRAARPRWRRARRRSPPTRPRPGRAPPSRSASDTNGDAARRAGPGMRLQRSRGSPGSLRSFVRNGALSDAIRSEPTRAVPIEAPRLVGGVLQAADLRGLLGRAPRTPSPRRAARPARPCPSPMQEHRHEHDPGAGVRRRGRRAGRPCRRAAQQPDPDDPARRGAAGSSFGMPIAASSSVIDSGSSRTPVSSAERPRATERNSGTAKKSRPASGTGRRTSCSPPVSCRF